MKTTFISTNGFYGNVSNTSYVSAGSNHLYIGSKKGSTFYYSSRITLPSIRSDVNIGDSNVLISKISLYLYRNNGGDTNVTVGCSSSSAWGAAYGKSRTTLLKANTGWQIVDLTPFAETLLGYKSNWYLHFTGGKSTSDAVFRVDGTGKDTAPYIEITWEYAANTISSNSVNAQLGSPIEFNIMPAVSDETHTLTYSIGETSDTIVVNGGNNISWIPPLSLASEVPNATSAAVKIIMTAYAPDGTKLRSEIFYQTIEIPAIVAPFIQSFNIQLVDGLNGYGLSGKSSVVLTPIVNMNDAFGATISDAYATIFVGGVSQTIRWTALTESDAGIFVGASANSAVINASGDAVLTFYVVDSRGRIVSTEASLLMCAYSAPVINSFAVERCEKILNENEEFDGWQASDLGGYVWVSIDSHITSVNPTGENELNALTWKIDAICEDTGNALIVNGSGNQAIRLVNDTSIFPDPVNESEAWRYTLTITDSVGVSSVQYDIVSPGRANLSMSPDKYGVAVGMMATGTKDDPKFEVSEEYVSHFYGDVWAHAGLLTAQGYRMDRVTKSEPMNIANGNFAVYADGFTPTLSRVGPIIFLDGYLKNIVALDSGFDITLANAIPEWARPAQRVAVLQQGSGSAIWWMIVYPDGGLRIHRYRTGSSDTAPSEGSQFPLTACWLAADAF